MLEIMWGVIGLSCGVIGSTVHDMVKSKKAKPKEKQEEKLMLGPQLVEVDVAHSTTPRIRVGVIDAMNGRILEVATSTHTNHGHYDWKTEMYVVPENQKLSEAMSLVMLMKGLEK